MLQDFLYEISVKDRHKPSYYPGYLLQVASPYLFRSLELGISIFFVIWYLVPGILIFNVLKL